MWERQEAAAFGQGSHLTDKELKLGVCQMTLLSDMQREM